MFNHAITNPTLSENELKKHRAFAQIEAISVLLKAVYSNREARIFRHWIMSGEGKCFRKRFFTLMENQFKALVIKYKAEQTWINAVFKALEERSFNEMSDLFGQYPEILEFISEDLSKADFMKEMNEEFSYWLQEIEERVVQKIKLQEMQRIRPQESQQMEYKELKKEPDLQMKKRPSTALTISIIASVATVAAVGTFFYFNARRKKLDATKIPPPVRPARL